MREHLFPNRAAYILDLKDAGVDLQRLGSGKPKDQEYLAMHAAMQKVLQKSGKKYRRVGAQKIRQPGPPNP